MPLPKGTAVSGSGQSQEEDDPHKAPPESLEEMKSRHKKEFKALEGEKRAALKNAKAKGKKGKAAAKDAEFKYLGLEQDLKDRHNIEISSMDGSAESTGKGNDVVADDILRADSIVDNGKAAVTQTTAQPSQEDEETKRLDAQEAKRKKASEKKLRKKANSRQKEMDRETQIEKENKDAGPSRRQMETDAMNALYLNTRNLRIMDVQADGNCLYRAVATQCQRLGLSLDDVSSAEVAGEEDFSKIRSICADVLLGSNRAEFEPFAELNASEGNDGGDNPSTYDSYVEMVRSSSTWGGQLEIRALCEGLKRPIIVYSSEGPPLTMGSEFGKSEEGDGEPEGSLMLSFHRHYYALGEHYNSVIPKEA